MNTTYQLWREITNHTDKIITESVVRWTAYDMERDGVINLHDMDTLCHNRKKMVELHNEEVIESANERLMEEAHQSAVHKAMSDYWVESEESIGWR